ncbi:MAG TPA: NUDIX hydrolase [Phycisphaerales bacterium]|nr:NUDIX hydrolase [Phycisphaerales bacterium]
MQRQLIHKGAKFSFERLTLTGTDGKPLTREVVRHPGAVVIVPILDEPTGRKVVFIKNWRIAVEDWLVELPAGTLEAGEDPAHCAARELEEETGYTAATIVPLGRFYTSPGLSDELMWAYAATGLKNVGQKLEPDERVVVHPIGVNEALAMIARAKLTDGKSIAAVLMAKERALLA